MEPIYLSQEKFDALTTELEELKTVTRPLINEKVQSARALGDLSENAEYHAARDAQGKNESRIQEIEAILKSASIITHHDSESVEMGCTVTVQKEGVTEPVVYQLVSPTEADMAHGKLSTASPLGSALLGKKKKETFVFETPKGTVTYTILRIV